MGAKIQKLQCMMHKPWVFSGMSVVQDEENQVCRGQSKFHDSKYSINAIWCKRWLTFSSNHYKMHHEKSSIHQVVFSEVNRSLSCKMYSILLLSQVCFLSAKWWHHHGMQMWRMYMRPTSLSRCILYNFTECHHQCDLLLSLTKNSS